MRFFIALILCAMNCFAAGRAERPNIIFVLTDDQGWFDLGAHGNPHIETPTLDRLKREGVSFSHCYAAPVCTPTRAGLMTGRYFQRTGAIDTYRGLDTMSTNEITIAQIAKGQGYRTALVGKWHLGRYASYHPNSRGFDEFFGFWQYGFINRYMDSDELFHNRTTVKTTGYITDVLTDQAMAFVERATNAPFFLYLAYNAPHDPHLVPDAYIDKYLKKGLPLGQARIYGMVTSIDENVGRLLKKVDDLGLRENTVVVFMTDNGGVSRYYKAGLRGNKTSVYEGGVRVPLLVRWPGKFPADKVVSSLVENVDLFPTFCELTGASVPRDRKIDGKSLLPMLRSGENQKLREFVHQQWTRTAPNAQTNWMVRDERFKLVNGELFDLQADPGEAKNVANEQPDRVKALRAQFMSWFNDVTSGQQYARVPIEIGHPLENPVELDVTWGDPVGSKVQPSYARYIRDHVRNWSVEGDAVRFKVNVLQTGTYRVSFEYGCAPEDAGSEFEIRCGDSTLRGVVQPTAGANTYRPFAIGTMPLKAGADTFEIKATRIKGKELMTLHKVFVEKVRSEATRSRSY